MVISLRVMEPLGNAHFEFQVKAENEMVHRNMISFYAAKMLCQDKFVAVQQPRAKGSAGRKSSCQALMVEKKPDTKVPG